VGLTFDELKARRKRREERIGVPLNEDLLKDISELEQMVAVAEHLDQQENRVPEAPKLRQRLDELRKVAEESAEFFTFQELPRLTFKELIRQHPDPDGKMRWDEDRFAPALLEASCTSHDFTYEQWKELFDEWGSWVVYPLFYTAYAVNDQESQVPFGPRKSGETRASEQN
jgi:hypothetical protein